MNIGRWIRGLQLVATVAVMGGACIALLDREHHALAADSFVKSVEEDHGTYYRLKVKLAYKGEKQDFDIVVGCNVRQINYKDNSSTYEVGLVPTVFGRRMSDGKGLVVRPPNACDGETTANGRVQPDLLPVVVVYDDAETLTFGIAYLSEDAYESPLSVLKFGGATIETATRAEFDAFRRTQANLVKRESYFAALDSDAGLKEKHFTRLTRPFGRLCEGYRRFLIPEATRALVRQHWPAGKPTYWRPDTYEAEAEMTRAIETSPQIHSDRLSDPPRAWEAFAQKGDANNGLVTRDGGGLVSGHRGAFVPPAFYPATDDYNVHRWPADPAQWPSFLSAKKVMVTSDIDFRDGRMRGFAYCSTGLRPTAEQAPSLEAANRKPEVYRVDRQDVVSKRPMGMVGDTWIFERDNHLFQHFWLYLESTRGDV